MRARGEPSTCTWFVADTRFYNNAQPFPHADVFCVANRRPDEQEHLRWCAVQHDQSLEYTYSNNCQSRS